MRTKSSKLFLAAICVTLLALGACSGSSRTSVSDGEDGNGANGSSSEKKAPQSFIVKAGTTIHRGSRHFTCPAAGADCAVTVEVNNSVTHTGGKLVWDLAATPERPRGFSLPASATGSFTVKTGETAMRGGADLMCAAGGADCLVVVDGDTVTASGGVVTVTMPRMVLARPAGAASSLSPWSETTIAAGSKMGNGRFDFACPSGGKACVVVVDVNGEASYSTSGAAPTIALSDRMVVTPVGAVPDGFATTAFYRDDIAPGETAKYGVFDFRCADDAAENCVVSVAADGEVSGTVIATVARVAVMNPSPVSAIEEGEDNDFTLAEGETVARNTYLEFSCPDDMDLGTMNTCGVLVAADGSITVTEGTRIRSLATVFHGETGRLAPTATGGEVAEAAAPMATAGLTMTARRMGITGAGSHGARNDDALIIEMLANDHDEGDMLSRITGELPMYTVTVRGDTGEVHMAGPRSVDGDRDAEADASAGAIRVYANIDTENIDTELKKSTFDRYQYPTYVLSDADAVTSIELDGDGGVTVKLGGADDQGLAFNDMRNDRAERRPTGDAGMTGDVLRQWAERNHDDLTIELGKDAYGADPHGDGAHYWRADVEFSAEHTTGADGVYELWLSNQAGRLADSDATYLQYAAYGLFNFMDNTLEDATSVADENGETRTYTPASARLQALHFGFETPEATSIAGLRARPVNITATYRGRTTALAMITTGTQGVLQDCSGGDCSATDPAVMAAIRKPTESLLRMRGDVSLTAIFGADAESGGNTMSGDIDNFEALVDDVWRRTVPADHFHIGEVSLHSTDIDQEGAYGGQVGVSPDGKWGDAQRAGNEEVGEFYRFGGEYRGRFYGPSTDTQGPEETAGWWRIVGGGANNEVHQVVGSFGARRR